MFWCVIFRWLFARTSARGQHATGFDEVSACTFASAREEAESARETALKLSANELAALLKSNSDESLSYRKIAVKYGVKNTDTIKAAKDILISEAQELAEANVQNDKVTSKNDVPSSNIILLPNYK